MKKIAVLVPVYNEEKTISDVVKGLKYELKRYSKKFDYSIYVINNNSTDNSRRLALEAGATLLDVKKQGKASCIKYALSRIKSDYYVMIDGDGTYPVNELHSILRPVLENKVDMTIGNRLTNFVKEEKQALHLFGNILISFFLKLFFGGKINDMLSGYRAFNYKLAKSIRIESKGFELETELTIKAIKKRFRIMEIPIRYKERKEGSKSKLNTFKDGFLILKKMISLYLNT